MQQECSPLDRRGGQTSTDPASPIKKKMVFILTCFVNPPYTPPPPKKKYNIYIYIYGVRYCYSCACEPFFFERCVRTRGALHLHVQGVPIPSGEASRGARILMRSEGSRHGMTFEQVCVVCVCVCVCVYLLNCT